MSAHTRGPWKVGEVRESSSRKADLVYARIDAERVVGAVAVYSGGKRGVVVSEEEALANARLIAAAPELLEALRLLARAYERVTGRESTPLLAKARAAIAKAEGKP